MFRKFHDVEVVDHGNGSVISVIYRIRAPIQELRHIYCMIQERGLNIAQKQMIQLRGGSIRVSRMRLIGLEEDMNNLLKLLLKPQTLSQ